MPPQRHLVKRQILELTVPGQEGAYEIQQAASRAFHSRMAAILDAQCSARSAPDVVHRIESLEVDLGEIPRAALETALPEAFAAAFGPALAHALRAERASAAAASPPETASRLELLATFADTGALPWWADADAPGLLDDAVAWASAHAPARLGAEAASLLARERPRRRMVRHLSDASLSALAEALAPSHRARLGPLQRDLAIVLAEAVGAVPQARLRLARWEAVLLSVCTPGAPPPDQPAWLRWVLLHVATATGVRYRALRADLAAAVGPPGRPFESALPDLLGPLLDDDALAVADRSDPTGPLADAPRVEAAAPPVSDPGAPAALLAHNPSADAQAPAPPDRPTSPDPSAPTGRLDGVPRIEATAHAASDPGAPTGRLDAGPSAGAPAPPGRSDPTGRLADGAPPEATTPAPYDRAARGAADRAAPLRTLDEWYVGDAGLVLLWPFLDRFFGVTGLVADRRFLDEAARHRAAGLLRHLADGQPEMAPEFHLPLCKALCGLPLDEAVDPGLAPAEAEAAEADALLRAVVAHAPVLNEMTPDGLRGSFLLRKGVLSVRDGAWLLRVERETFDVVLDRFPWSASLVRLPWMERPMAVEW